MKLMRFLDSDTDDVPIEEVDALYFDGYIVGDLTLKGVTIKITLPDGYSDIEISADWPRDVNSRYWKKIAKEYVLHDHDNIFATTPELNDDDGFIFFEE